MKRMWYVVEFENGTIEIIPDSWILDNGNCCYWPATRQKQAVAQAIRMKKAPDPNWKKSVIKKVRRKCGKCVFFRKFN